MSADFKQVARYVEKQWERNFIYIFMKIEGIIALQGVTFKENIMYTVCFILMNIYLTRSYYFDAFKISFYLVDQNWFISLIK